MFIQDLKIIENIQIKSRFYKMVVESRDIADQSKPGQFLHLKTSSTAYPLLRRPFSISQILENRLITILYEVIGEGTQLLTHFKPGDYINAYGPLGNSFAENTLPKRALLVGGGIGIAPLQFLFDFFTSKGITCDVIFGFRSLADMVGWAEFKSTHGDLIITTNDGSFGQKGFVTDAMKTVLKQDHTVYTCGPTPMLKAVSQLAAQSNVPCEVSIHNFMGCGFGVCLGCVFPTQSGYQRVCKDGPIFNGNELVFS